MKPNCHACKKDVPENELKVYHGKQWHLKCLRKLRKKAKKKFLGNLDLAFKSLKGDQNGSPRQ